MQLMLNVGLGVGDRPELIPCVSFRCQVYMRLMAWGCETS